MKGVKCHYHTIAINANELMLKADSSKSFVFGMKKVFGDLLHVTSSLMDEYSIDPSIRLVFSELTQLVKKAIHKHNSGDFGTQESEQQSQRRETQCCYDEVQIFLNSRKPLPQTDIGRGDFFKFLSEAEDRERDLQQILGNHSNIPNITHLKNRAVNKLTIKSKTKIPTVTLQSRQVQTQIYMETFTLILQQNRTCKKEKSQRAKEAQEQQKDKAEVVAIQVKESPQKNHNEQLQFKRKQNKLKSPNEKNFKKTAQNPKPLRNTNKLGAIDIQEKKQKGKPKGRISKITKDDFTGRKSNQLPALRDSKFKSQPAEQRNQQNRDSLMNSILKKEELLLESSVQTESIQTLFQNHLLDKKKETLNCIESLSKQVQAGETLLKSSVALKDKSKSVTKGGKEIGENTEFNQTGFLKYKGKLENRNGISDSVHGSPTEINAVTKERSITNDSLQKSQASKSRLRLDKQTKMYRQSSLGLFLDGIPNRDQPIYVELHEQSNKSNRNTITDCERDVLQPQLNEAANQKIHYFSIGKNKQKLGILPSINISTPKDKPSKFKSPYEHSFKSPKMPSAHEHKKTIHNPHKENSQHNEKKLFSTLQQKQKRMIKQIQNLLNDSGQTTNSRKIQMYIQFVETLHERECGKGCVHLSRFYDFLRRKNLPNRREVLVHRQNINFEEQLIRQ